MQPLTVVLVDDHLIVRQGLRALFETKSDFLVVGEASDGVSAIDLIEKTRPNVLVVDLALPRLSGMEVIWRAHRANMRMSIVVLTMHVNEAYVYEAFRNGASAFIFKEANFEEIRKAISAAQKGERYVSSPMSIEMLDLCATKVNLAGGDPDPYRSLTPRERQVLCMVAAGYTSIEIGNELRISSRTAEFHRARIWRKLSFRSQADLVRFAIARGLACPERR